jgi:tetratricopeptide (TPR) repeat protein
LFQPTPPARLSNNVNLGNDMEIPDSIHAEIKELCAEGDVLLEMREFSQAYENYIAALELVPEPKEEFSATTWIMAAIGDLYFQSKDFSQAVKVLSDSMHCAGALGNPFIHLRLGQAQFELNNQERAADELCRANMGAGKEIFAEEDPRYFSFLKTKISPPANGVW